MGCWSLAGALDAISLDITEFRVAELEIAACHLPFSKQNMNMADQN